MLEGGRRYCLDLPLRFAHLDRFVAPYGNRQPRSSQSSLNVFGAPRDFEDGETIESRYDYDATRLNRAWSRKKPADPVS